MKQDEAVITSFVERLAKQIQALLSEDSVNAVLEQARTALRDGFTDFELVGRSELDGHLASLEQLTQTIKELEHRIAQLEASR
jgi:BMFP domain-containing protein YqiC